MLIHLTVGSSGPNVKSVQEMLNFVGSSQPLLAVDGSFGPKTRARVVKFQQVAKLSPDGIVGPLTSKALMSAVWSAILKGSSGLPSF